MRGGEEVIAIRRLLLTKGYEEWRAGLLTEAYQHTGVWRGLGRTVGKVDVARAVDVNLVYVIAYVSYKLVTVYVDFTARHILDKLKAVKERCTCRAPIAGTFITNSVLAIAHNKVVQNHHGLRNDLFPSVIVAFAESSNR